MILRKSKKVQLFIIIIITLQLIISITIIVCRGYYDEYHDDYHKCYDQLINTTTSIKFHSNARRIFLIEYLPILRRLDLIDPIDRFRSIDTIFSSVPVFISAWSSNHHRESYSLCSNILNYRGMNESAKRLIVYNLGLTQSQMIDYRSVCRIVEFRNFTFSCYPSYVRNLKQYRWKPLVIATALLDFDAIWWLDSSMTFTDNTSMQSIYDSFKIDHQKLHFSFFGRTSHSIFASTHPQMYAYLPINEVMAKRLTMFDASHMLWYSTYQTRTNILKWWIWCALDRDCMAPDGAQIECTYANDQYNRYGNCHRFDQSALNIIVANIANGTTKLYQMQAPMRKVWIKNFWIF